ncbi:F0F1 ATP synthase subunit A [Peptostreptococcus equinus]|uniref:ATP synthase subunit a n=1 Tax=Peptostreptococcus equinus TaxID=3003601 RepID=A0ABY7JSC9_9FIRM|nr:FoF1 ATP synthase subunit a [Peptostreptococcus sp. CBA3647]WAW15068.1 F0F1 ATP synthase subunit A [Peptostreptococcus sp. CBA3647]
MYQARYLLYIGNFKISETIIVQWIIMLALIAVALFMTRGLKKNPDTKRQLLLEWFVGGIKGYTTEMMGTKFVSRVPSIVPYVGTIFLFFILSNLAGLFGFKSPTTDLDTTVAWASITIATMYVMGVKFKGPSYFKEFIEPTPVMLPLNIVGEIARPISLSFRPFGNILGGTIIMGLVYQLNAFLSSLIPNLKIPIGQIAFPVPLHLYFDIFAGSLQAFIFMTLTLVFIGNAAETE